MDVGGRLTVAHPPAWIPPDTIDLHALHLAEVLKLGLNGEAKHPSVVYPEDYFVQPRTRAQDRSMARAAFISGLALSVLGLTWLQSRRR